MYTYKVTDFPSSVLNSKDEERCHMEKRGKVSRTIKQRREGRGCISIERNKFTLRK